VSLSILVNSGNGAVVVALAGAADASMLEPLRVPITAAPAETPLLVLDLELDAHDPVHQEILRSVRPSDSPPTNP
jgi:hypothetical protein